MVKWSKEDYCKMQPGDFVKIIPALCDEPGRYDGLVGLIICETAHSSPSRRLFKLLVDGDPGWILSESDLAVINEGR